MKQRSIDELGCLQRAVMEIVWELGQASVHQVREKLAPKKKLAYTTVLTALQKLEKGGWLSHRCEGKSYIYTAAQTRQEAGARSVKAFLKRVFDGDAVLMFQHLIRESDLTEQELHQLKRMIEQKRKEMQK